MGVELSVISIWLFMVHPHSIITKIIQITDLIDFGQNRVRMDQNLPYTYERQFCTQLKQHLIYYMNIFDEPSFRSEEFANDTTYSHGLQIMNLISLRLYLRLNVIFLAASYDDTTRPKSLFTRYQKNHV